MTRLSYCSCGTRLDACAFQSLQGGGMVDAPASRPVPNNRSAGDGAVTRSMSVGRAGSSPAPGTRFAPAAVEWPSPIDCDPDTALVAAIEQAERATV